MYQNHQESQDKDSGFYAAKNETKFSTFNRQMESLFNSLEDNNPDKKAYYSGDSLYSTPLGKSRIQSPEIKLQIDIPDLQDGYGNVVVNSISPVFTSNPILPIRSPSLSVSARSANNRNSQDSSVSTWHLANYCKIIFNPNNIAFEY